MYLKVRITMIFICHRKGLYILTSLFLIYIYIFSIDILIDQSQHLG